MTKELALRLVDEFAAKTNAGVFKKLDRARIATGLRVRIETPSKIHQNSAGVCGPATIVYALASSQPLQYATAVTDLFETGKATVKKWTLKPDAELLAADCPAGMEGEPMEHVDWIILSSIRDSENWLYDYHSDKDDSDGTSMPELEKWMGKAGFSDIKSDDGGTFYTTMNDKERMLKKCLELFNGGYHVIMAINASIMSSSVQNYPKFAGLNHVVVLTGAFVVPPNRDAPVSIPVFTWGRKTTIPESGGLKYGQFLEHFYHYVAGKL